MKKFFTTTSFILLSLTSLFAATNPKDTVAETKVSFTFGGRVDVLMLSDSRKGVDSRNGTQYLFPDKPIYNSKCEDINAYGQLRFSVAPTRLYVGATATNILGATAKGYVEIDFMGVSDNVMSMIRMRHAYASLTWRNRSLLIGQTSHLSMIDEVAANTVTFGGGFPFYPLNRPVQVQFAQKFGKHSKVTLAAAMFGGAFGTQQSYAMMPDVQLRFQFGDPNVFTYGVVGGVKIIKPRTMTADSSLTNKTVTSFNVGVFARYTFAGGYAVRLWGMWGEDLSPLSIIGGYAPLLADKGQQDYDYVPTSALTSFIDLESKQYKSGLQWGILAGYQKNLGSTKELDLSKASIANFGIDSYWRVAPRLFYNYKNFLSFGIEYMFTGASWAEQMDTHYRPASLLPTVYNHRITLLARYKFQTK